MKEKHGQYIAIYWEDDSDVEYIMGHVTLEEARKALNMWSLGWGDGFNTVTHKWARWQPMRNGNHDMLLIIVEGPARGAFAVTEAAHIRLAAQAAPAAASTKEEA